MKLWKKAILVILLSLMCVFTSIGYASLSKTLLIEGQVEAEPPYGVFICSAEGSEGVVVNNYTMTVANVSVRLVNDENATATLHVDIFNNTIDYQAFKGVHYNEGEFTYDNTNIILGYSGLNIGDKLAPGAIAGIDVTFRYDSYRGIAEALNAVLEFHFGLAGEDQGTDYEEYVELFLSNIRGYGLNDTSKQEKGQVVLENLQTYGILYDGDNIQGGNLDKLYEAVNTDGTNRLTFIMDYINDTTIELYTYEEKYAASNYLNQTITVYKTTYIREAVGSEYTEWKSKNSVRGTAEIRSVNTPGGRQVYAAALGTWLQTSIS